MTNHGKHYPMIYSGDALGDRGIGVGYLETIQEIRVTGETSMSVHCLGLRLWSRFSLRSTQGRIPR
jgi:hypothetical protein